MEKVSFQLKIILLILFLNLEIDFVHSQHLSSYKEITIGKVSINPNMTPVIDGDSTDQIWKLTDKHPLIFTVPPDKDGDPTTPDGDPEKLPVGLHAFFKACYDSKYFYLYVNVTTQDVNIMDSLYPQQANAPWNYDNIEVFFNCNPHVVNKWDNDKPYNTIDANSAPKNYYMQPVGTRGSAEEIRFMRMKTANISHLSMDGRYGGDGRYNTGYGWGFDDYAYNHALAYSLFKYTKFVSKETGKGWSLEAKIPMTGILAEQFNKRWNTEKDTLIGFDIAVNCKDHLNLVWANNTGMGTEWRDTRLFGYIRLKNEIIAPPPKPVAPLKNKEKAKNEK